eukprot:80172-Pyramimonas_sp.AAC.1
MQRTLYVPTLAPHLTSLARPSCPALTRAPCRKLLGGRDWHCSSWQGGADQGAVTASLDRLVSVTKRFRILCGASLLPARRPSCMSTLPRNTC